MLCDELAKGKEEYTYDELSNVVGNDVSPGGKLYPALQSARRWVRKHKRISFETIVGGGKIVKLNNEGVIATNESLRKSIARKAKVGIETTRCIDAEKLSP